MLSHERRKHTVTVRVSGELDHSTAADIRAQIDALIDDPQILRLIFDFRALTFMDSSGIGVVLGRYKRMAKRGGTVAVQTSGRHMDKLMELAGLYQIVEKLA